jgi:hypothetical protein
MRNAIEIDDAKGILLAVTKSQGVLARMQERLVARLENQERPCPKGFVSDRASLT